MYFNDAVRWAEEAEALRPELVHRRVFPVRLVRPVPDPAAWQGWRAVPAGELREVLHVGQPRSWSCTFDMGEYCVGYIELTFRFRGRIDAPFRFRVKCAESPYELAADFDACRVSLGRGWLQEETFVFDAPPPVIRLPRRYAFRYLELAVESNSPGYVVTPESVCCDAVSSAADFRTLPPLSAEYDELDRAVDRIGSVTLAACMQECYEDGPKRDRRLWLGDLRIQALADYDRFRNLDLVRRCLLLFAAAADDEGRVPGCVYPGEGLPEAGNFVFDYGVLFGDVLLDFLRAGGDAAVVRGLLPVAERQCELSLREFERGRFVDRGCHWLFIDWQEGLEKECAVQGVVIEALQRFCRLACELDCGDRAARYLPVIEQLRGAARESWYDPEAGLFRGGGKSGQFSWASQIWMAMAGILPPSDTAALLRRTLAAGKIVRPGTPFLYNQMVLALERAGLRREAHALTREYWGKMAALGADAFWEVFLPEEPLRSPYGDPAMNSHCHAWSTPVYHFRRESSRNGLV